MLLYSLSDGFDNADRHPLFHVQPHTGELCVSQDIDRDAGPSVYDILIKAEDPVSDIFLRSPNNKAKPDSSQSSSDQLKNIYFCFFREVRVPKPMCILK